MPQNTMPDSFELTADSQSVNVNAANNLCLQVGQSGEVTISNGAGLDADSDLLSMFKEANPSSPAIDATACGTQYTATRDNEAGFQAADLVFQPTTSNTYGQTSVKASFEPSAVGMFAVCYRTTYSDIGSGAEWITDATWKVNVYPVPPTTLEVSSSGNALSGGTISVI